MLHEATSASSGDITQIIFQRNADISPSDLVELIDKVRSHFVAGPLFSGCAKG